MVYVIQLASRISKPVWHIPLLCVKWKTPDDGQRNCPKHVEFYTKNKFEKLVQLVGFIIRIYHDARSPERQIPLKFVRHWIKLNFQNKVYNRPKQLTSIVAKSGSPANYAFWGVVHFPSVYWVKSLCFFPASYLDVWSAFRSWLPVTGVTREFLRGKKVSPIPSPHTGGSDISLSGKDGPDINQAAAGRELITATQLRLCNW